HALRLFALRFRAQRVELLLPLVVGLELQLDGCAEDLQRGEEGVELVQRVGATVERVDVELERNVPMAVGDLERHPRLEVLRAAVAAVIAVRGSRKATFGRVLDVSVDVRTTVEAGQV